ncbi:MAG: hypothetical protein ACD_73C00523G0001 [uncultured bacterium]|nr:MAG: hypothetical protein ACD_73C00523G0001 [uncultured bacterium]
MFIPLEGLIDLEKEKARLEKKKIKIEKDITVLSKSLDDPSFTQNVAPELIAEKKQLLSEAQIELGVILKAQSLLK